MTDIRQWITAALAPLLPPTWRLIPYQTNLDQVAVPTCMLAVESITRTPSAPNGTRTVSYTLTVIEPNTEPGRADTALDDALLELIDAIDTQTAIQWREARRVVFGDRHPAYDLTLDVLTEKEEPTP